jgi:pSer/pThr/pTyr-binding forkhead associated (FHA) protein
MRFRLRYLHHDLELSEGQFAVGRNASCQLSLDDPLVSRRHALLTVEGEAVVVEDLQSRNGVVVNGRKIESRQRLQAGDRILIGGQELTFVIMPDSEGLSASAPVVPRVSPNAKLTVPKMPSATDSRPVSAIVNPGAAEGNDGEPSVIRRADAFNLLGSVADKALAMGRADEAERILASALADVIEACRGGRPLTPALVDMAARFSAKLATATGKGAWADYVIELYSAQARPCPASVIDELYNAFRKVNSVDLGRLRNYLALLRGRVTTFGPAERFLFQRLEGLERLAALR